jgi:hypothetical protein
MKTLFKCLVIIILLSGCSAQWHLKKAIQKNPDLLKVRDFVVDTLLITDSFYRLDSFTLKEIDTLVLDTGKIKTTIYRYKNKFIITQELKHDTIHFTKTIQLPPSVIRLTDNDKMKSYMLYSFLGGSLMTLILTIIFYGKRLGNSK